MSGLEDVEGVIRRLASAEQLLVMADFDGTLAPLVLHPDTARPDPVAMDALHRLSEAPGTWIAVVSGRTHRDLRRFVGDVPGIVLIGGHGAERSERVVLDAAQRGTLDRVVADLTDIAASAEGALLEVKQASAALHVRRVPADEASRLVAAALAGPGTLPGVRAIEGKEIVELSVSDADKGSAVRALRSEHPDAVALFIGDDVTDEHAFAALPLPDVTVKVGPESTAASYRLADQHAVPGFLQAIAVARLGD
jgi:trehalose 6-phosphate phosphatase